MKSVKRLGIWMDHSIAHVMELTNDSIETRTIESGSKLPKEEQNIKDERFMLNREQNQLAFFFKELSDIIKDFDDVILFGPTSAKKELLNNLKKNHLFEKIKIEMKTTDKMSENQLHSFVKEYFGKTQ